MELLLAIFILHCVLQQATYTVFVCFCPHRRYTCRSPLHIACRKNRGKACS